MSRLLPRLRATIIKHEVLSRDRLSLTRTISLSAARWRSAASYKPPSSFEESEEPDNADTKASWAPNPAGQVDKKLGRTERRAPAYVRREEAQRAIAALPKLSIDDFAQLSANGSATPDHARSCLYSLQAKVKAIPKLSGQRENAASYHVGGRVLHWLFNQTPVIQDELSCDRDFVDVMCYFIVAEQREDFIWKYLELHPETTDGFVPHQWLGGLARAHWDWTGSVEQPLLVLRKALQRFNRSQSLISLMTVLRKLCHSDTLQPYDPALFDMLITSELGDTKHIAQRKRAQTLLYHPTSADAKSFLEWIQQNPTDINAVMSARPANKNHTCTLMIRAAYITRLRGFEEDARWLESIVETRNPAVWRARDWIVDRCKDDPKLTHLRQEAKQS